MNIYQQVLDKIDGEINKRNEQIKELEKKVYDLRKERDEKIAKQSPLYDEKSSLIVARNEFFRLLKEKKRYKNKLGLYVFLGVFGMILISILSSSVGSVGALKFIILFICDIILVFLSFKSVAKNNKRINEIEAMINSMEENGFLNKVDERIKELNIAIERINKNIYNICHDLDLKQDMVSKLKANLDILLNKRNFIGNELLEALLLLSEEDKQVEDSLNKRFNEKGLPQEIADIPVLDMTLQRRKKGVIDGSTN